MGKLSIALADKVSSLFPIPPHPFNLANEKKQTYAEWQFEKGRDTIAFYLAFTDTDAMFSGKTVLDIGCGAGGKTVYYASLGAKRIVGLELLEKYRAEAESLAREKGFADIFEFSCQDAAKMSFESGTFDTIIMNDAMEHVDRPEEVLAECKRVLKPGGRLYINFPPYFHPFGAHLSDSIGMPWIHCFFGESTLVGLYKRRVRGLPDGQERIDFRIGQKPDGSEYFSYINKMTVKRFGGIFPKTGLNCVYYHEAPLRKIVAPAAKIPGMKELFVKMVVCILEK